MSRLFIGLSIGLLGLVGMELGHALDATPTHVVCQRECSPVAPVAVAQTRPSLPDEG